MDPDSKEPSRQKFIEMVKDMTIWFKIQGENPYENVVTCLEKCEDDLLHFCEARNHLNWKDKLTKMGERKTFSG